MTFLHSEPPGLVGPYLERLLVETEVGPAEAADVASGRTTRSGAAAAALRDGWSAAALAQTSGADQ